MHTHIGKTCTILSNSDMSGEIVVVVDCNRITTLDSGKKQIMLRADDILEFVADFLRNEKIEHLESLDFKDILKELIDK